MSIHSVIIGGTRGLGREVVRLFAEAGQTVSVIGKHPPSEGDRSLAGTHFWSLDLLDHSALKRALAEMIQRNGQLSNLVFLQRFKDQGDEWAREGETSLTATKVIIETVADQFVPFGDKSIVMVSSIADEFITLRQPVGYHVAKAGLVQMARYYAVVLGPKGIRVNCVAPATLVKQENQELYAANEELQGLFQRTIPLGRMGHALDSANVIAFLCSPKASFVTGQRITVDGGVSLLSQESLAREIAGV